MSSLKKNLFYNTFYQFLNIFIPLLTTPYLSRVLHAEGVGIYSYAYTVGYYFVTIAMLGLNNYGNRSVAICRDDKQNLSKTFWSIYTMQFFTAGIMIVLYVFYMLLIDQSMMGWIMLFYVVSSAFDINWFFFGLERFKLTVTRNSIIKIIGTILIFLLVKDEKDVYTYGIIMSISFLLSQLSIWPFVCREVNYRRPSTTEVIAHIKPNLILFIPVIAISLYKIMDKIMLGLMTNKTQVGLYESSEKIVQIPLALVTSLGTVMLPKMSNLVAKGDTKALNTYISNSILFAVFMTTSFCMGIMGVSKEFVPLFYGDGFELCIYLFQILLPSCVFIAIANVIRTQYLIPNSLDYIYVKSVILGAIINLIVNCLLIPGLASIGAAIGTLVAEATVCSYQIFAVRKRIPVFRFIVQTLPFLLSGIIMYVFLLFTNFTCSIFLLLLIKIFLGAVIYMAVLGIQYFLYGRKMWNINSIIKRNK